MSPNVYSATPTYLGSDLYVASDVDHDQQHSNPEYYSLARQMPCHFDGQYSLETAVEVGQWPSERGRRHQSADVPISSSELENSERGDVFPTNSDTVNDRGFLGNFDQQYSVATAVRVGQRPPERGTRNQRSGVSTSSSNVRRAAALPTMNCDAASPDSISDQYTAPTARAAAHVLRSLDQREMVETTAGDITQASTSPDSMQGQLDTNVATQLATPSHFDNQYSELARDHITAGDVWNGVADFGPRRVVERFQTRDATTSCDISAVYNMNHGDGTCGRSMNYAV